MGLLLLAVGWLAGRRSAPEAPPCAEPLPCVCAPSAARPSAPAPSTKPAHLDLPADTSPRERRRTAFLAWVRERSGSLQKCRPHGTLPVDATVTLEVSEDGRVAGVSVSGNGALDPRGLRCVREGMARWRLPAELRGEEARFMFGLER